jgi:hypothetical protein
VQTGAIRREVLRHAAAGRDDRRQVARSHRIDGGVGDLPRDEHRPLRRDGAVHHDENESAGVVADPIGGDVVRRQRCHWRYRRRRRYSVDSLERSDRPRLSVFDHGEIGRLQPAHRLTLAVEHRNVDANKLYACLERGARALILRLQRGRGDQAQDERRRSG